jgi:hypothetical protein|tara:strand:+ start:228 stop:812 length:585 start_codon:yes stop_codon:yes gene_type:complete
MTKLKTVNISGKQYVEVSERLKHFRSNYPGYSLLSEVVDINDTTITIKATILDDKQNPMASGIAQEVKGSSFINKTSYVENCETSAWGRALANFGIGIDAAVASYNEVANAKLNNSNIKEDKSKEDDLPLKDFDLEEVLGGIAWYRENRPEMSEKQIFQKIEDTYKDVDEVKIKLIKENSDGKAKPKKRNRKTA